jgi:nucleoid-associated protein YgaU
MFLLDERRQLMFGNKHDQGPDLGKVEQALSQAGSSGVRNLTARQNGSTIEIHGTADNLAAKQAAFQTITDRVGDASGVVNLIQVAVEPTRNVNQAMPQSMPGMAPGGMTSAAGASRTHTVAKGETLSHIAQHYYGKASEYQKIFEANRDQLKDPDKIREGMTLHIPS